MQANVFAALALCTVLLACPTIVATPQPVSVQATGTWTQEASGLRFPEQIGDWRRVQITRFDERGANVGVGYNHETLRASVTFTVYVYPSRSVAEADAGLAGDFALAEKSLHDHHPDAQVSWKRDETFQTRAGPVPVKAAEYRYVEDFAQARQPVLSQLHLFEVLGWTIKYRMTFAAVQEGEARDVAQRLLADSPWGRRVE